MLRCLSLVVVVVALVLSAPTRAHVFDAADLQRFAALRERAAGIGVELMKNLPDGSAPQDGVQLRGEHRRSTFTIRGPSAIPG